MSVLADCSNKLFNRNLHLTHWDMLSVLFEVVHGNAQLLFPFLAAQCLQVNVAFIPKWIQIIVDRM